MSQSEAALTPPNSELVMSVYRRMRRLILIGEMKAGEPLSQVKLAAQFQTSRGPVREAIRMLQREGLIEAETNQQGRVARFSVSDMEQVCAMLVLIVAAAIKAGDGRFTSADIAKTGRTIDRIERLALRSTGMSAERFERRMRWRQLGFRRLILTLSRHAGSHVVAHIDGLLDRIAMFRQIKNTESGPLPYPLDNRFADLRASLKECDAQAMAAILVEKIAHVSLEALNYVQENHRPFVLSHFIQCARDICAEPKHGVPGSLILKPDESLIFKITNRIDGNIELSIPK